MKPNLHLYQNLESKNKECELKLANSQNLASGYMSLVLSLILLQLQGTCIHKFLLV